MSSSLVSIITPFYNAEKYLKDTVNSVLTQSYQNWELILVNDGSTDNSLEVAKTFKDKRIRLITQRNGGQCNATNNAFKIAQGNYIQLLDADDIMDKDKTMNQVEHLLSYGDEYLGVSKWAFFYNDLDNAFFRDEAVFCDGNPIDWLYKLWTNDTMMHTNAYMIPRKILEGGGEYFDESLKLNVDFEFFTRMTLASKGVVYSSSALSYYRKGVQGAKTSNPSFAKQLSALEARVKSVKHLFRYDQSEKAKEAARMAITILTFTFPSLLPYSKMKLKELGLENFGQFQGRYFKYISSLLGFENAIRAKKIYNRFR